MVFRKNFLMLLLSHVIGGFYFQTEEMARKKKESVGWVYIHGFYYWLAMVMVSLPALSWKVVLYGSIASIVHLVIDVAKYYYIRWGNIAEYRSRHYRLFHSVYVLNPVSSHIIT